MTLIRSHHPCRAPRLPLAVAIVLLALLGAAPCALAQQALRPGSPLLDRTWKASWIAAPDTPPDAFGVFHFRRSFSLAERPDSFVVHVSADNRYRLFVNGSPVADGPARGDLMHWRFETVDLAPHLRAGRNVLAAVVWNYGPHKPVAQISFRTAFLVQGDTERESLVDTGPEWRVLQNPAYSPIPISYADVDGYYAAPPGEALDARRYPWGWEKPEYDDTRWAPAQELRRAEPRGVHPYGHGDGWQLVPRSIPSMEEFPHRFARVARAEGMRASAGFLRGAGDLVIPARSRVVLLLDQGYLTNAYPVMETSGGDGAALRLIYAEALRDARGNKGNRGEIEGKTIKGFHDSLTLDGGERRLFRSLWFRTYRYVQLEVQTGDQPLRIHDLHGVFTGYPFELRARFASDLPWLADMWEVNWRTARLNAWETYFDCPYYEQLQYVGDTRIQALISLYLSGDDRLMRDALAHFDASRTADGITASRHPSNLIQLIPPFSLIWVAMVHDHWMHRGDSGLVRSYLPGIQSVLQWYERRVDETGLLGPMPWWNFVDWAYSTPPFQRGVPPGADRGNSVLVSLQYLYALQRAADLLEAHQEPELAGRYRRQADALRKAIRTRAWDASRGLFADSPEKRVFSQHTNVMAVLTDVAEPAERQALMTRVLADSSLVPAGYYFQFYVNEALLRAGLGDRYVERLAPWREMLRMGLTTVPEMPEPTRSDAHAWSAHPNYGLLATVLGVRPAEPGFRSVRISPALGPLRRVEGRIPHPSGDIEVRLHRVGRDGLRGEVTLPEGVTGSFQWNGESVPLRPGRQRVGR